MQVREWENCPPWRKLAEVAKRVSHEKQLLHSKPGDAGMIYASASDYEEAFELPIKLMIAEAELKLIMKHAQREMPSMGQEAFEKQAEINKLYFELAKREHPDA